MRCIVCLLTVVIVLVSAYEVYCSELKAQLQASISANMHLESTCDDLRRQLAESEKEKVKLEDRVSEMRGCEIESVHQRSVVAMLSAMTCLTISHIRRDRNKVIYTCTVNDGNIKGQQHNLLGRGATLNYDPCYCHKPIA